MTDIINSLAHRAEVEQAQQIRAELCESRGLEPVCCGMPATCDSCTKPSSGGHVQRMAELIAERDQLQTRVAVLEQQLRRVLPVLDYYGAGQRDTGYAHAQITQIGGLLRTKEGGAV